MIFIIILLGIIFVLSFLGIGILASMLLKSINPPKPSIEEKPSINKKRPPKR